MVSKFLPGGEVFQYRIVEFIMFLFPEIICTVLQMIKKRFKFGKQNQGNFIKRLQLMKDNWTGLLFRGARL